jgi:hypothetical protein
VKSDFFKKQLFTETQKKTLGEEFLHQELVGLLSAKNFAEGFFFGLCRDFFVLSVNNSSPRAQGDRRLSSMIYTPADFVSRISKLEPTTIHLLLMHI